MFLRYAPSVFGAIDKIREDEQEREAAKSRARDAAQHGSGPKYGGGGGW